jgi:hypothetical protein
LLLEDRGQLIESRAGQILVALAVQKSCDDVFDGDENRFRARGLF